jgi:Ca2+-binding EF-hand superfamily protein
LLGLLGTDIAENFAQRIFDIFSSDKKNIKLNEYLKYVDIYHHGDENERCRITFRLMDKKDDGFITHEDFQSYLYLIIEAIKKVHPTVTDNLLTGKEIEMLFKKISDGKDVFTYNQFESMYYKKPELLSWIDYFKNNDEEVLYFVNKNLLMLIATQEKFFENMKNILINLNITDDHFNLNPAIDEINKFCRIIEAKRKKFLHSGSVFNIRTIFDNLTKAFNDTKGRSPMPKPTMKGDIKFDFKKKSFQESEGEMEDKDSQLFEGIPVVDVHPIDTNKTEEAFCIYLLI